ncbi:ABC transporter permease, partial [Agrococcus sp. ARC_14]|uniref:ABC transporter permease n=1 Tax=Agrococcus sp. ARC_14 TaxID=2919927 RepID=UPI002407D53E
PPTPPAATPWPFDARRVRDHHDQEPGPCGLTETVTYSCSSPLYSIPKVALAPLFIVWFGIGIDMKIILAAVSVFFLVFLNTAAGVRDVDRGLIDAVRLMGGTRRDIALKVVLPASMSGLLTGLKVSIPYALIGAVIGELVASNRGLGYLINDSAAQFNTAGVFAAVAVLTVLAMVLNGLVGLLAARANRWKPLDA